MRRFFLIEVLLIFWVRFDVWFSVVWDFVEALVVRWGVVCLRLCYRIIVCFRSVSFYFTFVGCGFLY